MSAALHPLWSTVQGLWEVREWRNAHAVLHMVHPSEWDDILTILASFCLCKSAIVQAGGNKSPGISTKIDSQFLARGWEEKHFDTRITIDNRSYDSPTHKVDCFRNGVALELEWNNKDPFYDRDLNNFRLLYDLRVIDVGVIITRCDALQVIFNQLGKGKSYGQNTTHMSQLLKRIEGGGGGGCPVMVFGISPKLYDPNC